MPPSSLIRLLPLLLVSASLSLAATAKNCGCGCCKGKEVCCCQPADQAASDTTARHPLRGVVTRIEADASALMVKHEAIPGVMPAMTMQFKAGPAALQPLRQGQTITATMVRRGDDWWLEDIKPAGRTP